MSKTPREQGSPAGRGHRAADHPAVQREGRFLLRSIGGGIADKDIDLDDLVENTTDAVILIDADNVISFWNRGAERMFQYSREEVLGQKVGFIVPRHLMDSRELEWLQRKIDQEGSIHNHVTQRVRKDGRELWVSLNRTALHDTDGQVIGSTATIRDITEHRRTEEELYRSRSLAIVGELAARVAHEIKNPLAGIYGALQLLARDLEPDDPRKEVFDNMGSEVRRLDETAQDLLRFARPVPPKPMPMELCSFVAALVDHLERQPEVREHDIQVDIDEGTIVPLDHRLLEQVIVNLVLNAAQAMDSPGTIRIGASRRGSKVAIEVSDTGPGIPHDQLNTIFDPFFTTKARGTGLGLAVARKNVEAHGGTIEAENEDGGGARFVITLPAP